LTYVVTIGGVSNLWVQPANGDTAKQVNQFETDLIETFDWARDCKSIAIVRRNRTSDVVQLRTSN
jgi:hypothetical protein